MSHFTVPLIIMCVFILLDIVTGIARGAMQGRIDSTSMRNGLFHKSAYFFAYALAVALEIGSQFLEFGFTIPAVAAVAVYIVATEVVSILENIVALNPALADKEFLKLFGKKVDSADNSH